ncbi:MAG: hypothetical protein ACXU7H_13345 [Burkholderiaceae bacterium]
MKEIEKVRQIPGEAKRRWFSSTVMDLIVWLDEKDVPSGFQLCYDKGQAERAITWTRLHGFTHMKVEDGEKMSGLGYKATPVLVNGGAVDIKMANDLFMANGTHLPTEIANFVTGKISEFLARHENV